MVVRIAHRTRKECAHPEFTKVQSGPRSFFLYEFGQLKIGIPAAIFTLNSAQTTDIRQSRIAGAIKSSHKQNGTAADTQQTRSRNRYSRLVHEPQANMLPRAHIVERPLIGFGKLRNTQEPLFIANRRLWPRAAQTGPSSKKVPYVGIDVLNSAIRRLKQRRNARLARDPVANR